MTPDHGQGLLQPVDSRRGMVGLRLVAARETDDMRFGYAASPDADLSPLATRGALHSVGGDVRHLLDSGQAACGRQALDTKVQL